MAELLYGPLELPQHDRRWDPREGRAEAVLAQAALDRPRRRLLQREQRAVEPEQPQQEPVPLPPASQQRRQLEEARWRRGGSRDGRGAILRGRLRLAARTLAVSDALICRWSACNSITGRQGESTRGRRGRARGRRARRGAAGAFLHLLRLLGACRVGEELLSRSRRGATESPRKARIHNGTVPMATGSTRDAESLTASLLGSILKRSGFTPVEFSSLGTSDEEGSATEEGAEGWGEGVGVGGEQMEEDLASRLRPRP